MAQIAPRVTVEVVDWGGRGPALVFLAGLGNTAHIFDDFAPQFTDHFHAISITRRGFGASAGSPPARELDTLVADITAVLDSLRIQQPLLVGHSIAGEELTRFAELHPTRCAGLVYIDAAYDRTSIDSLAKEQPTAPSPHVNAADTVSFSSVRALYARVLGVQEPDAEIRATERFDAADRYLGAVTANSLKARVTSGSQMARYDRAHCRALALYAVPDSIADVLPYYGEFDASGRTQGEAVFRFVQRVVAESRARIQRFPQNTVVEVHGGNHYIFLQQPKAVAETMRVFLSGSSSLRRSSER
ncbi:MAG: alpha/beta hydrolase [bacterium]